MPRFPDVTAYAIKAEIRDLRARRYRLDRQKSMYGGKHIGKGDTVYVFASETHGGPGLIARGIVAAAEPVPRTPGVERQTPRVSVTIERLTSASGRLGRSELKRFADWDDGRPETELNFKLYRQATDKIIGISGTTASFLDGYFEDTNA